MKLPRKLPVTLWVDIETRSRVNLKRWGVYPYVECPDWCILMAGWAIDDGPVQLAVGHDEIRRIPGLYDPDVLKVAHNAMFERINFSELRGEVANLAPDDWEDSMMLAAEYGLPLSLDGMAKALGAAPKDSAGSALVRFFTVPNRKGEWNRPEDHPEKWEAFCAYCRQDVDTMRDAVRRLPRRPTRMERQVWLADQRINDLGIRVDVPMARRAIANAQRNAADALAEMAARTGLQNPNSGVQLLPWFQGQGLRSMKNLQAPTVARLLNSEAVNADTPKAQNVKRVLQLRQEVALVASKKFEAAVGGVCADGRLRGQFKFYGAHTGRWSGRGVQLQNLPRVQFKDATAESVARLDLAVGAQLPPDELKMLVRSMFVGPFTVVDYSAIEARVIAWLAGEEWVLESFQAGHDIYVETAKAMSDGRTPEEGGMTRFEGKVAVLALGYQGSVGSMRTMGYRSSPEQRAQALAMLNADSPTPVTAASKKFIQWEDGEILKIVRAWRSANPYIVQFWYDLQSAFRNGGKAGRIQIVADGTSRAMALPSGRALWYHDVREEWIVAEDPETGEKRRKKQLTFRDREKGFRVGTYGGRLAENATQAVARDVLAEALVRLVIREGLPVVGHVHDEVLVDGAPDLARVKRVMCESPRWAAGLPLAAEGFICERYRKG